MQHEVVHRCSGVFARSALEMSEHATIPVLQRITPLRYVLRCAREAGVLVFVLKRGRHM
jgi:hypothetical protein